MQTTCPECRTTFRITQDHLGLRRGLVRCGQCNAVFNAYDTLLAELDAPPNSEIHQALAEHREMPEELAGGHAELEPAPALAAFNEEGLASNAEFPMGSELESEPAAPDEPDAWILAQDVFPLQDEPLPNDAWEPNPAIPPPADALPVATPSLGPEPSPFVETSESILLAELPTRLRASRPRLPLWKSLLLWMAAASLTLILFAQVAYFFRAELATAYPPARPVMTGLCGFLGCEVPLPRQLTREAIAASSLEHDNEQKSRVRLTVLLANRTGQIQAWPQLDLRLTDVRDAPVAHTLFPPVSYLPKGTDISAGMAADSEKEIRLDLDVGNLAPSGYSLSLAYP